MRWRGGQVKLNEALEFGRDSLGEGKSCEVEDGNVVIFSGGPWICSCPKNGFELATDKGEKV